MELLLQGVVVDSEMLTYNFPHWYNNIKLADVVQMWDTCLLLY